MILREKTYLADKYYFEKPTLRMIHYFGVQWIPPSQPSTLLRLGGSANCEVTKSDGPRTAGLLPLESCNLLPKVRTAPTLFAS